MTECANRTELVEYSVEIDPTKEVLVVLSTEDWEFFANFYPDRERRASWQEMAAQFDILRHALREGEVAA